MTETAAQKAEYPQASMGGISTTIDVGCHAIIALQHPNGVTTEIPAGRIRSLHLFTPLLLTGKNEHENIKYNYSCRVSPNLEQPLINGVKQDVSIGNFIREIPAGLATLIHERVETMAPQLVSRVGMRHIREKFMVEYAGKEYLILLDLRVQQ
jgi:hypothetical protein